MSSDHPSLSRLLTLQWTVRGGSTAEVLTTPELPYSTGKTCYRRAANSSGKLLPAFSTDVTDSGEIACFKEVPKLLFGVYPKQACALRFPTPKLSNQMKGISCMDAPPSGPTTRVGPGHHPRLTPLFSPERRCLWILALSPDLTFTADPSLCSN